jgi:hypothetical protein
MSLSPEIFIPDDHIINTQESMGDEANVSTMGDELQVVVETPNTSLMKDQVMPPKQVPEKRCSERLKKDML